MPLRRDLVADALKAGFDGSAHSQHYDGERAEKFRRTMRPKCVVGEDEKRETERNNVRR